MDKSFHVTPSEWKMALEIYESLTPGSIIIQLPEAEGPLLLFQLKMFLILSCELIKGKKKKKRNQTQSSYSVNVCRMNVILQN